MLHIDELCPACEAGAIGFRMCSDNKTLAMMCDECNAVWLRPDAISLELAVFPESPDYVVDQLRCSVASSAGASWATLEQIKAANLEAFIAGGGTPLNE